ncbi:MAG: DUF3047 domain-containing protein [Hydrogenophaga sp.]|uniref:DUF3047 domain-containing protein n=1 Tax=Hydrogenophaga sp. TaxID=1904254 RepID=UPI001D59A7F1|nr:DUF3047 domain-containing protein [Hydrogenophaga sp.]MBW0169067.1 DUF3047 domain-containing protein [Hydrogenophaga sp.]MBW0185451.1 DUF3047 domain-containing protein [Hydrogenophaga sp.]
MKSQNSPASLTTGDALISRSLQTSAFAICLAWALSGCAGVSWESAGTSDETPPLRPQRVATGASAALVEASARLFATPADGVPWEPFYFPGKRYVPFEPVQVDGRPALRVRAKSSVSILRQRFVPSLDKVGRLSFSWRVDAVSPTADLADSALADSPVRVVLAFDGDRSRWPARTHRLSEMSRLLTGEELPYATLVYVWSVKEPVGTVVVNPRTDRIRKLVLDSGTAEVGHWRNHVRDVRADFRQAFGEEPGPLRLVGLMTDTDNTESALTAWYGALSLEHAVD